jgi:hypothetical protein
LITVTPASRCGRMQAWFKTCKFKTYKFKTCNKTCKVPG